MPMTYEVPYPQTPKAINTPMTAANNNLDGSGTIATIFTAGANGALVTSLRAMCRVNTAATTVRLFISTDAGVTWHLFDEKVMAAYNPAATTAQNPVIFVDKTNPDQAIRLPANARLGGAIAVAGNIMMVGEAMDY